MRIIDLEKWPGKKHYLWFKNYPLPYYSVTSNIDITLFYQYIKKHQLPFFIPLMFILNKALNEIEEMRLRIVDDQVVLYDTIHPAYTIMTNQGIFENCESDFDNSFATYFFHAKRAIDEVKKGVNLNKDYNDYSKLNYYYFTCLPWINFTSITHPMPNDPTISIPRIGWGKYIFTNERWIMALNIQVHHALVDGYPLSQAFLKIQAFLNAPEIHLKEATYNK